MSDEYTPSAEKLQEAYEYRVEGWDSSDGREVERFLAAHDHTLREQIAGDLQTEAENLDLEVPNAHREGMREGLLRAVDIARGEVSR